MTRSWVSNIAGLVLAASGATAFGQAMTFEGLTDNEPVLNYYNGGTGGAGTGPGPNFGITFSNNSIAGIASDQGGTANFRNAPSGKTTMFFLTGTSVMNVPAGFTTGFSFFYAGTQAGSITVYSGVNKTGSVLATIPLAVNNFSACVPAVFYCNWTPVGVTFAGTAMSVDFAGTANFIGFDNITINSSTPVGAVPAGPVIPVPTLGPLGLLLLTLLAGVSGLMTLRLTRRT